MLKKWISQKEVHPAKKLLPPLRTRIIRNFFVTCWGESKVATKAGFHTRCLTVCMFHLHVSILGSQLMSDATTQPLKYRMLKKWISQKEVHPAKKLLPPLRSRLLRIFFVTCWGESKVATKAGFHTRCLTVCMFHLHVSILGSQLTTLVIKKFDFSFLN